jgi:hypothetical protein
MKNDYCFGTKFTKISLEADALWMGFQHGEGELEIENQGRFGSHSSKSFSQETVAIGQRVPRIGIERPKQRVLSAGCAENSDSTPRFFFSAAFSAAVSSVVDRADD